MLVQCTLYQLRRQVSRVGRGNGRAVCDSSRPHQVETKARKVPMQGEIGIMELIPILALTQVMNRCELSLHGLPSSKVNVRTRCMAVRADAMKATPFSTVIQGTTHQNFWSLAPSVSALDHCVSFVEVPVRETITWTSLRSPVQLGCDLDCSRGLDEGGERKALGYARQRRKEPLMGSGAMCTNRHLHILGRLLQNARRAAKHRGIGRCTW
jgi:hypothetical protein